MESAAHIMTPLSKFQSTDQARIVIRPPQVTSVNASSSLILACVAYGDPVPTISWNKGSSELTNSSTVTIYQDVLEIRGVAFMTSILFYSHSCNRKVKALTNSFRRFDC